MTGWISLHRQIRNHWIWDDADKLKWWLDILLLTNHTDKKSVYNNEVILIKRGTFKTSEVKLSERWGVSRNTVRKFLKLLESDEMITSNKTPYGTTIEVLNYNDYQGFSMKKEQPSEQPFEQPSEQHKDSLLNNGVNNTVNTTNNYNNSNNELTMNNNDNNDNKTDVMREIISFYESNGYGTISQSIVEEMDGWYSEGFQKEAIIRALRIGVDENERKMKYVRGILKNWRNANTKTLSAIESEERKRKVSNFKRNDDYQLTPEQQAQFDRLPF